MKTLRRFIDEDDMDFDKAAESAVEKRKFLLNRVTQEKVLPDESDNDEEAEEEVEASVSYFNQAHDSYNRVRLERGNRYL